jgi:hypothetical protein
MADSFDIMDILVASMAAIVYPAGTSNPSVTGRPVMCYPGWASQAALDADLLSGKSHISVFQAPGGQNATRYPQTFHRIGDPAPATLGWAVAGVTATLSGTVTVPQNVGIIVDNVAYTYAVLAHDTLASVAAALVALIVVNRPCTSAGAVLTIPSSALIVARVGTVSNIAQELARQKENYQVTVWSPTPNDRKTLTRAIQVSMASTPRIATPDGFGARVRYRNGVPLDDAQKAILYRYDLFYEVEYAITASSTAPQAIAWTVNVYGGSVDPTALPPLVFNF